MSRNWNWVEWKMSHCSQTLLLIAFLTTGETRRGDFPRYRTAYACEGSRLHISCEKGHIIRLLRANYGRFSISICNEHGNLDWSVDCTSQRSFHVIQESCAMKTNCSLPASTALFGDPCAGTLKYLEAHYQCVPESSAPTPLTTPTSTTSTIPSTTTSRPPIIIPVTRYARLFPPTIPEGSEGSMAVASTTLSPSSSGPTDREAANRSEGEGISFTSQSSSGSLERTESLSATSLTSARPPTRKETTVQVVPTIAPSTGNEDTTSSSSDVSEFHYCPPTTVKSLQWNWTRAGQLAVQRCPGGALGRARWRCDIATNQWTPEYPDLSDCSSLWVDNIKYRAARGDSVVTLASELAAITRTKPLYGGDILHTADILHRLILKMADRVHDIEEERQKHRLLQELTESVLEVSNSLLEDFQRPSWRDLPATQQRRAALGLMRSLETSGWLLAEAHRSRYSLRTAQSNILLSVEVLEEWPSSGIVVPLPHEATWWRTEDSLVLPSKLLSETSKQGVSKLVFVTYDRIRELMGAGVQTFHSGYIDSNITRMINSRVISASVDGSQFLSTDIHVATTFKHSQVDNVSNPVCVFWDYKARSWSPEGCWVIGSNLSHTVCQCDHLSTLALIMDVIATQPVQDKASSLRIVVYIGCAVAMVCLLVTLLILQFVRCLRSDRATIHKNLCLCLLLSEATVAGGIDQTSVPRVCCIVAGLIHYLLLAVFAWTFLDSFQLYVMLVEIFESEKWRLRWYCSVAYGVPLLVVGISALIDPDSYGTASYCWLRVDNYYIFSFGGPAIACALATLLFLSLTLWRLCWKRENFTAVKNKDQTKLTSVKVWSGEATIVLILLCSTWGFLVLYLHEQTPVTAYTFMSLNILLGLLMFIFYSVRDGKANKIFEDSPMPGRLCGCLRRSHPSQRRRALCRPAEIAPAVRHHSLPHQPWSSPLSDDPSHGVTRDLQSLTTVSTFKPEEHPLQCLLQKNKNLMDRVDFSSGDWPHPDRMQKEQDGVLWQPNLLPDDFYHQRHQALCCYRRSESSPQVRELLCHCAEETHLTPTHAETQQGEWTSPTGSNRERQSTGLVYANDRNILTSLAAVLTGSPRARHILRDSCLRPQVAYSGIHSPTDSDRSSSSLMDGRESETPPSSPGQEVPDLQLLQSMPNLRLPDGASLSASLTY